MQPYFLPYIGYFQLIQAVEKFIVYDNIQYSKGGWINRNRMLLGGKDFLFTLPVKKGSDYLNIADRQLADGVEREKKKILSQIYSSYSKAPCFGEVYPLIEQIFQFNDKNLFSFIFNSIKQVSGYIGIKSELIVSSHLPVDVSLKSQEKVMALVKALNGDTYINPIGGLELYSKEVFQKNNISLYFLKPDLTPYRQRVDPFIPGLSIIDILMFNDSNNVQKLLSSYELI